MMDMDFAVVIIIIVVIINNINIVPHTHTKGRKKKRLGLPSLDTSCFKACLESVFQNMSKRCMFFLIKKKKTCSQSGLSETAATSIEPGSF